MTEPKAAHRPDTTEEADRVQRAALQRMSPAEKIQAASDMADLARELSKAGIRSAHPDWSPDEVEAEWRQRLAGNR